MTGEEQTRWPGSGAWGEHGACVGLIFRVGIVEWVLLHETKDLRHRDGC